LNRQILIDTWFAALHHFDKKFFSLVDGPPNVIDVIGHRLANRDDLSACDSGNCVGRCSHGGTHLKVYFTQSAIVARPPY
jgi:hypothetical protein